MKKQIKAIKPQAIKNSRIVSGQKPKKLAVSYFRIAKNSNTCKLIHHRQTSHLILVILLIIVGLFINYAKKTVDYQAVLGSSTVLVTAVVPGEVSGVGQTNDNQASNSNTSSNTPSTDSPISVDETKLVAENIFIKEHKFWFDVSIPVYYIILALTLGFWVGDLFDKKFGLLKKSKKVRRL